MGCCAPQESYRLLSPLNLVAVCFLPSLETTRSVIVFPGVRIKSALSLLALVAVGEMDGQMDGTKKVPWTTSLLPLLYRNSEFPLTCVRTPMTRVPKETRTQRCPHRCCSRCRGPHSSLRYHRRVCVPTRRVSARSFLPGTAGFRRCRCNSPALLRSRCWDRSSGPCSWDRRACTAQGRKVRGELAEKTSGVRLNLSPGPFLPPAGIFPAEALGRLGEGKEGVRRSPGWQGRTFLMSMSRTARFPPMGQFWM